MASNLAWLWMTNKWPSRLIDHINNDPSDDRWANLRQADYSQNGANSKARQGKTTPKGVTFDKRAGLYAARIKVNYRTINLGLFNAPEEAHAAYVAAARRYFGKFARTD